MPPSLKTPERLEALATVAQLSARGRPVLETDRFLMSPIPAHKPAGGSTSCLPLDPDCEKSITASLLAKVPVRPDENPHARYIRRILSAQAPGVATQFPITGLKDKASLVSARVQALPSASGGRKPQGSEDISDLFLPGGAPILDHLVVRMRSSPDWAQYLEGAEYIQHHRLPNLDSLVEVWEITLGETSEDLIDHYIQLVREAIDKTRAKFGTCLLAADTESITTIKAAGPDHFPLLEDGSVLMPVPQRGQPGEPIPVRLMIGHLTWAVHIRLPIEEVLTDTGTALKIIPGELQANVNELLSLMPNLVGVGVEKDIKRFTKLIKALYDLDDDQSLYQCLPLTLDLEVLARAAGYNMIHFRVSALCWAALGVLLPKGECSVGDGQWWVTWNGMPQPLRAYLEGDTAQVAATAWTFSMALIMQMFPDTHVTRVLSIHDQSGLIRWVERHVFRELTEVELAKGAWKCPADWDGLADIIFPADEEKLCLVRKIFPPWPSVTAGGARHIHSVRDWAINSMLNYQAIDKKSWPTRALTEYHSLRFGRVVDSANYPKDPVDCIGFARNPGIKHFLSGPLEEITKLQVHVKTGDGASAKSLLLEYVRIEPDKALPLLNEIESGHPRHRRLFMHPRTAGEVIRALRPMMFAWNLLPKRPLGWTDVFSIPNRPQELDALIAAGEKKAKELREKAELLRAQAEDVESVTKAAKKMRTAILEDTWPMPCLVSSRAHREVTKLPSQAAAMVGTRGPPKKRTRVEPEATVTSGELERMEAESVDSGGSSRAVVAAAPTALLGSLMSTESTSSASRESGPPIRDARNILSSRRGQVEPEVDNCEPVVQHYTDWEAMSHYTVEEDSEIEDRWSRRVESSRQFAHDRTEMAGWGSISSHGSHRDAAASLQRRGSWSPEPPRHLRGGRVLTDVFEDDLGRPRRTAWRQPSPPPNFDAEEHRRLWDLVREQYGPVEPRPRYYPG